MIDHSFVPTVRRAATVAGLAVLAAAAAGAQQSAAPSHRESGNLVLEGIPPPHPALIARLEHYQQSRQATFLDWLPDGSMLIATRFGDTEQVHRVASPLGMREQLTFYPDPIAWARAPRSGNGFVFLKDQGGDENAQLYYQAGRRQQRASSPTATSSTAAPCGRTTASAWPSTATTATRSATTSMSQDVTSAAAPQLVVGGHEDTWYPLDWSPDDSQLLVWKYVSISESYLYVADVASGALTPLEQRPEEGRHPHRQVRPRRPRGLRGDGRGRRVRAAEAQGSPHPREPQRQPRPQWDVEDFDVSADGRYIAYVVNEDGRSRLTVLDTLAQARARAGRAPRGPHRQPALRSHRTPPRACRRSPRSARAMSTSTTSSTASSSAGPAARPVPSMRHSLVVARARPLSDLGSRRRKPRMLSAYVYRPRSAGPVPGGDRHPRRSRSRSTARDGIRSCSSW